MNKKYMWIFCIGIFLLIGCDKNNSSKEENQKKDNQTIVSCSIEEEGTYYKSNVQNEATFEENEIVYFTLNVDKHYDDAYDAKDDDWIISTQDSLENNTKKGLTGKVEVKDNVGYVTISYDLKENPELKDMVTSYQTLDDYYEHMIEAGYTCMKK